MGLNWLYFTHRTAFKPLLHVYAVPWQALESSRGFPCFKLGCCKLDTKQCAWIAVKFSSRTLARRRFQRLWIGNVFDICKQKLPTVSMATSSLVSVHHAVVVQQKSGHREVNFHSNDRKGLILSYFNGVVRNAEVRS